MKNKVTSWVIEFYSRRGHQKEFWNETTKNKEEFDRLVERASEYRKQNEWGSYKLKKV